MQVSYNLLKEYVGIELSPAELADRLSMNGIVAEHSNTIFDNVSGVIVGEIKEIVPHKKNKNLSICFVNIKNKEEEVVCGAKNMRVGDFVPLALNGAFLPAIGKIGSKEINGVKSNGMICSASELGLEKGKSPGVLILDRTFPLGEEINKIKNIKNDVIYNFEIFSNRPDLMSIIGIAREISSFSGKDLHIPEIQIEENDVKIADKISVQIKDQELCPRYAGRIIEGLKVKKSPFWLRWKLYLLGIRPINNVVDVTNYVMMETGQPLHAFDLNYIRGSRIIVRRAYPGEKFSTLDGIQRELTEENLLIADKEGAIALAGVMGGENSEIKEQTKDVFLESAYFNPVNNRRTSRFFSLRTDASNRFEKGIDPEGQLYALNRAAFLINELTDTKTLAGIIDNRNKNFIKKNIINLNFKKLAKILGTNIAVTDTGSGDNAREILIRLGFEVKKQDDESITVVPPSFRGDIQIDVDVIEEIAKVFGYEKIPTTLFKSTVIQKGKDLQQTMIDKVRDILVGCGLHQMISYSMITPDYFDLMHLPDFHYLRKAVQLSNPLIKDQTIMRTTLIPGLFNAIQWNANRKVEKIKLFEMGKVFFSEKSPQDNRLPMEKIMISGAVSKMDGSGNIWERKERRDIFYLKGILETLFDSLGINNIEYIQGSFPVFDPEKNGIIKVNDNNIGIFGEINRSIVDNLGITSDICLFEIDFSVLYANIKKRTVFKPLPKYPYVQRDISMIVNEEIKLGKIQKIIKERNNDLIKRVQIFDIFRGKQIDRGNKSIAFSIIFQSEYRTLTDDEVDKMMNDIKIELINHFEAKIRE